MHLKMRYYNFIRGLNVGINDNVKIDIGTYLGLFQDGKMDRVKLDRLKKSYHQKRVSDDIEFK